MQIIRALVLYSLSPKSSVEFALATSPDFPSPVALIRNAKLSWDRLCRGKGSMNMLGDGGRDPS